MAIASHQNNIFKELFVIIYSLQDAAKFLGCSKKTVQRMVERGEIPLPLREEKDKGGKIWRIWDSSQWEEIKKIVQQRRKHKPSIAKVSSKKDTNKKTNTSIKPKKTKS
jgi:predicted site-specific integrase-resolvase